LDAKAELQWVRSLLEDLRSGQLTWDLEQIFHEIREASNTRLCATTGQTKDQATNEIPERMSHAHALYNHIPRNVRRHFLR